MRSGRNLFAPALAAAHNWLQGYSVVHTKYKVNHHKYETMYLQCGKQGIERAGRQF